MIFDYFVTGLHRHGDTTIIKVTSQMNRSTRLSSAIFLVSYTGRKFVPWSTSQDKWLIVTHSRHLFCDSGTRTCRSYHNEMNSSNEQLYQAVFGYLLAVLQWQEVRAVMEPPNKGIIKNVFLHLFWQFDSHTQGSYGDHSHFANGDTHCIWVSSVILHLPQKHAPFVPWSILCRKWWFVVECLPLFW
jgi:hypothetical protein